MKRIKPAFTQKVVTDGIRVRTAWELDTERATLEDWRQLAQVWNDGPKEWIAALEANLAAVKQVTPPIQLRIDAIRSILARLPTSPVDLNRAQMQQLTDALQHWTEITVLRDVMPKAKLGQAFAKGRKLGTEGPIKKAARKVMRARPGIKTLDIWKAIQERPPKGWQALENRLGRYFEGPTAKDNMSYPRFQNVCSEIRKEEGQGRLKITG